MQVLVAEASGKVVGFATICYIGRNFWELRWMVVHPDYQEQGIGSKLLSEIIPYVKQRKGKKITVLTSVNNKKAIGLYRKFGFIETYQSQHMDLRL
jgi:ribosomal protein S18 acetylase RimI-like enzyme